MFFLSAPAQMAPFQELEKMPFLGRAANEDRTGRLKKLEHQLAFSHLPSLGVPSVHEQVEPYQVANLLFLFPSFLHLLFTGYLLSVPCPRTLPFTLPMV